MDKPYVLSCAFLRGASTCLVPASEHFEKALLSCWEDGRATWPQISLSAEGFAEHLGNCLRKDQDPETFLAEVRVGDLYLAWGCAQNIPAALEAFDQHFLPGVAAPLARRFSPSPAFIEEVQQILREKLLIGPSVREREIAGYHGHGALSSWLRITAFTTAQDLVRKKTPSLIGDKELAAVLAAKAVGNAERDFIKAHHQRDLAEALQTALLALPAEQRNVLRWHVFDGMTCRRIAEMLNISDRTVSRWLDAAHKSLHKGIRRHLRQRLRLSEEEFDSMIGQILSGFNLSLRVFLGK